MDETWKRYANDFNAMTDEEVAEEVRRSEDQLAEAGGWLEAVASWEAAGRPRRDLDEKPISADLFRAAVERGW